MRSNTDVQRAATFICGEEKQPEWLVPALNQVIEFELVPAAKQLGVARSAVGDVVQKIIDAAEILAKSLGSKSLAGIAIAGGGPGPGLDEDNELQVRLYPMLARAKQQSEILSRPGRGPWEPSDALGQAREKCATVVTIAWHLVRGRFPKASNKEASQACDALWAAAELDKATYNHQKAEAFGWRDVIRGILPPDPDGPHVPPPAEGEPDTRKHDPGAVIRGFMWQRMGCPQPGMPDK